MRKRLKKMWTVFKKDWQLDLMILIPFIYMLIFHYAPMFGLQIAFKNYTPRAGILGSEWVGLKNFQKFFSNYRWSQYVLNTLKITTYTIFVGFPVPIFLALMIHMNEHRWLKKIVQNISYIPYFISTVVMVGILNQILNPFGGLWGSICSYFGWVAEDLRSLPGAFIHLYVWSGIWQTMGWSTIIYISALSSVSEELHEAARLDGASRWQRVIHVDLPAIMPTICIMLILRFGGILSVGHEKVYLMQNSLNLEQSEVISTYVYKSGIAKNNMSYGTAVGLMNSVISTAMVILVNWITNKLSDGEQGLF